MRRSREVKRYITKRINDRLEWKGSKGYLQVYNRGKKVRPFTASDSRGHGRVHGRQDLVWAEPLHEC